MLLPKKMSKKECRERSSQAVKVAVGETMNGWRTKDEMERYCERKRKELPKSRGEQVRV
jgi:hypothetical protein